MKLSDSFNINFYVNKECLTVEARGQNDCCNLLIELTKRIHEEVVESGVKFLLFDFQSIEFNIDWTDCFNLIRL